jgi:hypothetical protein
LANSNNLAEENKNTPAEAYFLLGGQTSMCAQAANHLEMGCK